MPVAWQAQHRKSVNLGGTVEVSKMIEGRGRSIWSTSLCSLSAVVQCTPARSEMLSVCAVSFCMAGAVLGAPRVTPKLVLQRALVQEDPAKTARVSCRNIVQR